MYIYSKDSALNNLQWLVRHKTKLNQTKPLTGTTASSQSGTWE